MGTRKEINPNEACKEPTKTLLVNVKLPLRTWPIFQFAQKVKYLEHYLLHQHLITTVNQHIGSLQLVDRGSMTSHKFNEIILGQDQNRRNTEGPCTRLISCMPCIMIMLHPVHQVPQRSKPRAEFDFSFVFKIRWSC